MYPRFAPLYSVLVPRAALSFEGHLAWRLFYDVALSGYLMPGLPDVGTAYALEQALVIEPEARLFRFRSFIVTHDSPPVMSPDMRTMPTR